MTFFDKWDKSSNERFTRLDNAISQIILNTSLENFLYYKHKAID